MKRKIEQKLLAWKNSSNRKPLLVYGARQVGKTYILKKFGADHYKKLVYINLELEKDVAEIFKKSLAPSKILPMLELIKNVSITSDDTLLFFDEIQVCEEALTCLKYFAEESPEYHIVAAGSLLGVAVNREKFSFPVGKVNSLVLYPMDFEEFLWAADKENLAEFIRQCYEKRQALPEAVHEKALEVYHQYLVVGGMPEAVQQFLQGDNYFLAGMIQHQILDNYVADMAKYADAGETVRIRAAFASLPAQLAKENHKFQYKVVKKGGTSAMFGISLEWLAQAGLVIKCCRTEQGILPLSVYGNLSDFKLYMADVGLLVAHANVQPASILLHQDNTFMGAITENYVAQQLTACGYKLFYWSRTDSQAELDFVVEEEGNLMGMEVKRSIHRRSRSLGMFVKQFQPQRAIRFSEENFYVTNNVENIPLYAVFCLSKENM